MTRTSLPAPLAGVCVAALVVAVLTPPTPYSERVVTLLFALFTLSYLVVGTLVSAKRPDNPIGWLMLGMGVVGSTAVLAGSYAGYALIIRPDLPLGLHAAWLTSWLYWPILTGIAVLALTFPEGRPRGRMRVWSVRIVVVATVTLCLATALTPGPMDGFGGVRNPWAVTGLGPVLRPLVLASAGAVAIVFVGAMVSIFVRLRRSSGHERRQLSLLAYATALLTISQAVNVPGLGLDDSFVGLLSVVLAIVAFPAAVAVAILRHRLYEIDQLISRTLVYAALTAALLGTYLLAVLLFRLLLAPVTGSNDLAVAGSTLAVAALFRPVRSRIQSVVDRRFYRRRYDAARSVELFAGRLRQEVDLDAVSADLRATVRDTVQPAHVTVWLRAEGAAR